MKPLIRFPYEGELRSIPEIAKMCGVKRSTLQYRLNNGIPLDEAVKPIPLRSQATYDASELTPQQRETMREFERLGKIEERARARLNMTPLVESK